MLDGRKVTLSWLSDSPAGLYAVGSPAAVIPLGRRRSSLSAAIPQPRGRDTAGTTGDTVTVRTYNGLDNAARTS